MKCKGKKKYIALLAVGSLLLVIGGVMFPVMDVIIESEIKKKIVISNTSELYDVWQDIPVPVYMQFYMFNVTNMEEIQQGGKPAVIQSGPYTYRERRVKFDIVWNSNGTVTYRQNRTFTFMRNMSVGGENDIIITINPLMAVIAQSLRWFPDNLKLIISLFMEVAAGEKLFMSRPVGELLWGYDDESLIMLGKVLPTWFSSSNVGYFIRKNYTDDGLYTVLTGETNIDDVGKVSTYNGDKQVPIWKSEAARSIKGTDGTLGPPLAFDLKQSSAFVSDMCRSVTGIYSGITHTPQGIELHRFGGNPMTMANATINPENEGYCTPDTTHCLPSGLLNSTLCEEPLDGFRIPVVFSFPHFLYGDPEVINSVDGIQPIEKEHAPVVDAEPWTGLVLQAAKRLQVNIFVDEVPGIRQTAKLRKLYFPVFWLNESSVTDDKHANMLKDELFTPMEIADIGKYCLLGLGGFLFLIGLALLIKKRKPVTETRRSVAVNHHYGTGAPVGARDGSHLFSNPSTDPLEHSGWRNNPTSSQSGEQSSLVNSASHQEDGRP